MHDREPKGRLIDPNEVNHASICATAGLYIPLIIRNFIWNLQRLIINPKLYRAQKVL